VRSTSLIRSARASSSLLLRTGWRCDLQTFCRRDQNSYCCGDCGTLPSPGRRVSGAPSKNMRGWRATPMPSSSHRPSGPNLLGSRTSRLRPRKRPRRGVEPEWLRLVRV
jgi:hypothetical protein